MPVNCPKCSRPILVTDVIESFDRRLSHLDCARPHGLRPEERALIFVYCSGHPVAHCAACNVGFGFTELASDILGGRTNLCPRCRTDLTESVRGHLFTCMTLPSEIRQRTQDVRDAAQRLIKQSQQAMDRSDVLIRDKEAPSTGAAAGSPGNNGTESRGQQMTSAASGIPSLASIMFCR